MTLGIPMKTGATMGLRSLMIRLECDHFKLNQFET